MTNTYIKSKKKKTYMALMLSVRFVSNERNCFPLFVKPLISDPAATKIFSCGVLRTPPSSSRSIFRPGRVLNTACKTLNIAFREKKVKHKFLYCKPFSFTLKCTNYDFKFIKYYSSTI